MLTPQRAPLHIDLGNGCTLHTLRGREDVARVAAFTASVFGDEVGGMMENLLTHHPGLEPADQFFVTDAAGKIVSSLCLIAWTWRYGTGGHIGDQSVDLPVGEMGIVATDPAYRRQGLIRAQVEQFKARLAERGCVLSCIQGIPYYYRQFGYEYTLPLEGGWRIELRRIADPQPELLHRYHVRRATPDDAPQLAARYAEAARGLSPHAVRRTEHWTYLLQVAGWDGSGEHDIWVVTAQETNTPETILAYVDLPKYHFGDELTVGDASHFTVATAQVMLAHLRDRARGAGQPAIRLNLHAQSDLVQIARTLDAYDMGTYAWQIHIPDAAALLDAMRPVLSARLADSLFQHHSGTLRIGFYRAGVELHFEDGQVTAVNPIILTEGTAPDCSLPPMALAPLFLGQRTVEELRAAYPDVSAHGLHRLVLNTLFPPTSAFIYPQY